MAILKFRKGLRFRFLLLALVTAVTLLPMPLQASAVSIVSDNQFEGFLGADDGTIDNCRFERTFGSGDWSIVQASSSGLRSNPVHGNSHSYYLTNIAYQHVLIQQTVDEFNVEQIRNLYVDSVVSLTFSCWFYSMDNEKVRVVAFTEYASGNGGTIFRGNWIDPSTKTGDNKWTLAEINFQMNTNLYDGIIVKIEAYDPYSQYTNLYVDDARLVLNTCSLYAGCGLPGGPFYGYVSTLAVIETIKDYWLEPNTNNEMQLSFAFAAVASGSYRVAQMQVFVELNPIVWPWMADCDAEVNIIAKTECNSGNYHGSVGSGGSYDLASKSGLWALKLIFSQGAPIVIGKAAGVGGILFGELLTLYMDTFVNDDTHAEGGIWFDYYTRTTWDYSITRPSWVTNTDYVSINWPRGDVFDIIFRVKVGFLDKLDPPSQAPHYFEYTIPLHISA